MSDTLYINLERCVEITHEDVTIGDIAKLECKNQAIVNKIKSIKLLSDKPESKKRYVVSIMKIIEIVDETCQNVDINNVGETDCIIEFNKSDSENKVIEAVKGAVICIILFFGAGFSIMSFNNDVSINEMFGQLAVQIGGVGSNGKSIIELFYSIGLAVGIIIFYNHIFGKKITKDPTPIETEMNKYETEINDAIVEGHNKKNKKIDVN